MRRVVIAWIALVALLAGNIGTAYLGSGMTYATAHAS